MLPKTQIKPGDKAPISGEYKIIGPDDALIRTGITMEQDEIMPPTPGPDQYYVKVVEK